MSAPRPIARRRARPVFDGPTYMAPRYHSRTGGRIVFILFLLALSVLVGGGGGLYWSLHRSQGSSSGVVSFHVGSGDNVTSIASRLHSRGLINNALLFKLDARLQGLATKLKVGEYRFKRNMSIDQMVAALTVYRQAQTTVTIPEGMRMEEIAAILRARGLDAKGFLQEVQHPHLHVSILADKPANATLEGYLFPETYDFPQGYSGRRIAAEMIKQLDKEFTPSMRLAVRQQGRTIYDVLKLASIVEREARVPDERPLIAGVYFNRLHSADKIMNADPTVQYIVGKPGNWWPILQVPARQVQPNSPYNTYTHSGLPPSPIANPGIASIRAAVYPTPTKYMYFVARKHGHGRHVFAVTLAQQTQNISQYGQ